VTSKSCAVKNQEDTRGDSDHAAMLYAYLICELNYGKLKFCLRQGYSQTMAHVDWSIIPQSTVCN